MDKKNELHCLNVDRHPAVDTSVFLTITCYFYCLLVSMLSKKIAYKYDILASCCLLMIIGFFYVLYGQWPIGESFL